MKPTRPNRTGRPTAADSVMTSMNVAKEVLERYKPSGRLLEPCRGTGNIYGLMEGSKDWCEITEGRDFMDYEGRVDWIVTNPPYSTYNEFLGKCFEVADNVVLIVPIAKAFKSMSIERLVDEYGGLKEIWLMGSGTKLGFGFGFPTGCLYYKRGYKGTITRIFNNK